MSRHLLDAYNKRSFPNGSEGKNNASWELSGDVKLLFAIFWLVVAVFFNAVVPANAQVNVTQFHNHES
jgi:hypothetical protein